MKLYYASASPFARKCLVVALERGVKGVEPVAVATSPVKQDPTVAAQNPSGKIPALVLDDGGIVADSRVIAEYIDSLGQGPGLIPASGAARFRVLTLASHADALMDAAILLRYETFLRPKDLQWSEWIDAQSAKVLRTLDVFEKEVGSWGDRVDMAAVTLGVALGYLDLRFADLGWRQGRPALAAWYERFSQRPSMAATVPT